MKATLAILVAAVVAGAAGCATSSSPDEAARLAANATKRPMLDKACVQDTGSRIKPSRADEAKANCMQPGSTYTREELDNTGEIDTGRALRQLDPRIQ